MSGDLGEILLSTHGLILASVALDLAFGDPVYRLHPVRLLGELSQKLEGLLRALRLSGLVGGILLGLLLTAAALGFCLVPARLFLHVHWIFSWAWLVFIGWNTLAVKDLILHARRIQNCAAAHDLEGARHHVGMLTGRDTKRLDHAACNRAAVESLGESLVDGILSPLFYFALFGLPGAVVFKVFSTMDSMVGFKTERYLYFGRFGARTDDLLNYIPARISPWLIALAARLVPGCSPSAALEVAREQHHHIPGPNSGWSETALAGALCRRIVGPIYKNDQLVTNLWLGRPRDPECGRDEDVDRSIALVLISAYGFALGAVALSWILSPASLY